MDIRVIIKRSAIFASLVLVITSIYALIAFILSVYVQDILGTQSVIMNGVITGILVSLGFEPLKRWLSKTTDSFLFKGEYNPQELLAELSDKLNETLDLSRLLDNISATLLKAFRSEKVSIYLYDKDKKSFDESVFAGTRTMPGISIPVKQVRGYEKALKQFGIEREILVTEEFKKITEGIEVPEINEIIRLLEERSVNAVVPIYLKDELMGLLFLGNKKSGDVYTNEDLRLLAVVAGQSATAIENAKLYEEQKEFNKRLRDEVKKATKELREANKQLKVLDQAKSEFINIASHQLRTPLTAIRGYASMLEQGDFGKLPDKVQMPVERIEDSSARIINLVNDLLNISRIESGRMQYEIEPTDIKQIVQEVYNDIQVLAQKKKLAFDLHITEKKIPKILIDPKKIREVVMNLADNAIKYTESGSVTVSLDVTDNQVLYAVQDTGRGIAPEDMDKLFQKFSRIEGASMTKAGGTGLGLFIAKKIVEKHYGNIWAESEGEGKGTTFKLSLPIKNKKLEKDLKEAGGNTLEKRA